MSRIAIPAVEPASGATADVSAQARKIAGEAVPNLFAAVRHLAPNALTPTWRVQAGPDRDQIPAPIQIATSGGAWRNSRVIQHRYTSPSTNHATPSTSAAFSRLTSSQISDTAPIAGNTSPPNTPILRSP